MNTFLQNTFNTTTTQNGAITHKSSLSACLDLFSMGVSSSSKNSLIASALKENPVLAIKTILYLRDVRNGQGNKDIARAFHAVVNTTLTKYPAFYKPYINLIKHLPEVGSWKDVYNLYGINNKLDKAIISLVADALNNNNALAAKWFPRQSQFHKDYAKSLGLDIGTVRRQVAKLTSVVETAMCNKQWHTINYEHVPSRANLVYSKAFLRNDSSRRQDFLAKAEAGTASIKASVLYPHEITRKSFSDSSMEALWKALPDYMESSEKFNILPIVDVSGSMSDSVPGTKVTCMDIAIGLGLYAAEHNRGAYKDILCTFDSRPMFHKLTGTTLASRVHETQRLPWGMSTNLQAVFDKILSNSIRANTEDLPKVILIISDMEFNECDSNYMTNYQLINQKYASAGIDMPTIVFWRVNTILAQQPVTKDERGTILINGYSPSILKHILSMDLSSLEDIAPMNMFLNTVQSRYSYVDELFNQ